MRWAEVALVAILLAPLASAGAPLSNAWLHAQGTASFPGPSAASGIPYALYAPHTAGLAALTIRATNAHLYLYEEEYREVPTTPPTLVNVYPNNKAEDWTTTSLGVTLVQADEGWMGAHLRTGGRFVKAGDLPFDASTASPERIGNGAGQSEKAGGDPTRPVFDAQVAGDHLDVVAQQVRLEGPGLVKLMGPMVRIVDDKGERTVQTGVSRTGDQTTTDDVVWTWLSIEADDLVVEGEGAEFLVATGALHVSAAGNVRFDAAQGELSTGDQSFLAQGGPLFLAGDFDAALVPFASGGVPTMRVDVEGTLESTSLVGHAIAPRAASDVAWLFPLGLGAVLGAGGLLVASVVRRVQARWDPEDCLALAEAAADERRFELALLWIRRARIRSPTSQRLFLQEAYLLALQGSPAQALDMLRAHPEHARTPEGALMTARILIVGGEPRRAGEVLAGALREVPILLVEIEGDATFHAVQDDADLRRAKERARTWLDREE